MQHKKSVKKITLFSSRTLAAQIILQVLDKGQSLSFLLPTAQHKLKSQDSAFLQEMTFGICRVLPRLERILKTLLDKPLKGKTRIVHCLLLVGLYQLLYMRIPPYSAVDEVVNATKSLNVENFHGLVNAVLRRFLREREDILANVDKHWQTLHPEWLVNRLKKSYPMNWRDIIEANNQKPPMWLRVNMQQNTTKNYLYLLDREGICANETNMPQALCLAQGVSVNRLPNFEKGVVTVQDLNAQWAALLLDPKNGECILDACAAPGGKTTHILEIAPQAKVIALDIEAHRLKRVEDNLMRLNQQACLVCGDARQPDEWLTRINQSMVSFDRILLDAPCSATGVIRRHPDIKWLRQESDIAKLVELQYQIINALWEKLKPNGILLYVTCSVLPDENSQQIERFLAEHLDAECCELPFGEKEGEVGFQFFPEDRGGDGFYYAKMRKRMDVNESTFN